ncbi:hypothetical protein PV569_33695 [Streptomyces scabiei]|nr:hypothetical protein [Streptomyces scabiei]MDX3298618.1 hypothetical protein [Streptomyces scabiei]
MTPTPADQVTAYLICGTAGCLLLLTLTILITAAAAVRRTRHHDPERP